MRHAGGCAQTWLQSLTSCSSSQVNRNVGMYMKKKKNTGNIIVNIQRHTYMILNYFIFSATFCIQVLHLTARVPLPDLKILISIPVTRSLTHGPPGTKYLAMLPPVATHQISSGHACHARCFPTVDCCITLFFKKKMFFACKITELTLVI